MKLAISTMSYLAHFQDALWSFSDFLQECARLGVDGVEIQDRHAPLVSEHPAQEVQFWKKLKEEIAGAGLQIAMFTPELFFDKPDEEEERIRRFLELIDVAVIIGTDRVRIFPSALSTLKTCAFYAETKNVILVLENHGGETRTAEGHIGLIESIGSPALRINLDTGNYPENPLENIKKAIDSGYVRFVHVKHYGYGEGVKMVDHGRILPMLKQGGYDDWLSIEFEGARHDAAGVNIEKEVVEKIVRKMQAILKNL